MNNNYTIIELQQGSAEWLEWRKNGIGASDAPAIMDENPYKSSKQLLKEKLGPIRESIKNSAMSLGTSLEPEARRRYILKKGVDVKPICLQSNKFNWLRASLDGMTLTYDTVVEIKCGESVYRRTRENKHVPGYYYGQLQHILAVTDLEEIDFFCYWPGNSEILLPVHRNNNYIEHMLNKEYDFWNLMNKNYLSIF